MADTKTNAMRILDKAKITYQTHSYEAKDGKIDGESVALKIGKDVKSVYKTLVTQGNSKNFYVFVIPVCEELDLKKVAKAVGEKSVAMIKVADINKYTGYIRGGCSPVGMKKLYTTVFDEAVNNLSTVIVSAGKIGSQIEVAPFDLIKITSAKTADIIFKKEV